MNSGGKGTAIIQTDVTLVGKLLGGFVESQVSASTKAAVIIKLNLGVTASDWFFLANGNNNGSGGGMDTTNMSNDLSITGAWPNIRQSASGAYI